MKNYFKRMKNQLHDKNYSDLGLLKKFLSVYNTSPIKLLLLDLTEFDKQ